MERDTIIAVSTPFGYGGLGIVRLSGEKALSITLNFFNPKRQHPHFPSGKAVLGKIAGSGKKDIIEEAFVIYFKAPLTYTKEDMVEISCHGSPVILEEVVRLGIKEGARLAEPGEFTLRAYLNGRIDILQAEAIHGMIYASSIEQAKVAYRQMEGGLSKRLRALRGQIVDLLSRIEASLEFPEENLKISTKTIEKVLEKTIRSVKELVDSYKLGKVLSEGQIVALAGKPNVGKSTLFNALLEKERSIVTPFPGTTRDYLQEKIHIKDSVFTLTDMAGLETTNQPIEREGIKKGKKIVKSADGILLLLDVSLPKTHEDAAMIQKFKDKNVILLFNKTDLKIKMDIAQILARFPHLDSLEISAKTGKNIAALKNLMWEKFVPPAGKGEDVILRLRQKLLLEDILSALRQGKRLLREGYSEELASEEIRRAVPLIGELTGEIMNEEILQDIFSRFCVGK